MTIDQQANLQLLRQSHCRNIVWLPIRVHQNLQNPRKINYGSCGLRFGEAINLLDNGTDIDFENNRINIVNRPGTKDIPSFKIKDKQAISVPMPTWVSKILIEVQANAEEGCPFIFL